MTSSTNRKYITYRNAVRGRPSRGHMATCTRNCCSSVVWFSRYAGGQTDRQTDKQTNILITLLRIAPRVDVEVRLPDRRHILEPPHIYKLHQIFYTLCLWPWLVPAFAPLQYVMNFGVLWTMFIIMDPMAACRYRSVMHGLTPLVRCKTYRLRPVPVDGACADTIY